MEAIQIYVPLLTSDSKCPLYKTVPSGSSNPFFIVMIPTTILHTRGNDDRLRYIPLMSRDRFAQASSQLCGVFQLSLLMFGLHLLRRGHQSYLHAIFISTYAT